MREGMRQAPRYGSGGRVVPPARSRYSSSGCVYCRPSINRYARPRRIAAHQLRRAAEFRRIFTPSGLKTKRRLPDTVDARSLRAVHAADHGELLRQRDRRRGRARTRRENPAPWVDVTERLGWSSRPSCEARGGAVPGHEIRARRNLERGLDALARSVSPDDASPERPSCR